MKSFKTNGLSRLFSFVLIAVILVCTVGFAVGGLQSNNSLDSNNSGDVGNNTDNTDEDTDNKDQINSTVDEDQDSSLDETNKEPIIQPVKYYNTITGLEISENDTARSPLGVIVDPSLPLYGVSNSDITFEFPIENGKTRLLSYTTNYSALWKIGSLCPTRAYISFVSNFIGGIVVSYGNDDIIKYSAWDASKIDLDLSEISDCYYCENTLYIYTSKDMIDKACSNEQIINNNSYNTPPYKFSNSDIKGTLNAESVVLPYSANNKTELIYSTETNKYLLFKSNERKVDMLNGKNIAFTNVFVLFANTTTYETNNGTELVLDNTSGGSGYYVSNGYATEIKWSVNEVGALEFKTLDGEILEVNRGNAYIGYFKASESLKIKIS